MEWIIIAILIAGYFIHKAIKEMAVKNQESLDSSKKNLIQELIDWEKLADEEYDDKVNKTSKANKETDKMLNKLRDSEIKPIFEEYIRVVKELPKMKLKYIRLRERYRLASTENRIKVVQVWEHYLSQVSSIRLWLYGFSFKKGDLDTQQLSTLREDFVVLDETKKIFEEMLNKET